MKLSKQNQPEQTEQWKMNSEWTTQNGTRYKQFNKWKTTKMTRFCNIREERVNHYTQPGCIFYPPTEGGLDTTLQVTSKFCTVLGGLSFKSASMLIITDFKKHEIASEYWTVEIRSWIIVISEPAVQQFNVGFVLHAA